MQRILAVDPGGHTGLAWTLDSGASLHSLTLKGYPDAECEVFDWLHNNLFGGSYQAPQKFELVVIERFATAGRISFDGLSTVDLVGQLRGLCKLYGVPVYLHTPAMRTAWQREAERCVAQGLTAPAVLKAIGGARIGRTRHEDDALAHLLMTLETGR